MTLIFPINNIQVKSLLTEPEKLVFLTVSLYFDKKTCDYDFCWHDHVAISKSLKLFFKYLLKGRHRFSIIINLK